MDSITVSSNIHRCWNTIGIRGDRSCPELANFIHCRNCPVYSVGGHQLLERSVPNNYRQEWTQLVAQSSAGVEKKSVISADSHLIDGANVQAALTVAIFRLQQEWLALSAQVFKETTPPKVIHSLPHRSNQILRGLVNIRGELHMCISLSHLLHLENSDRPPATISPVVYQRMVVIEKAGEVWVFAVDELYGLHKFHQHELKNAPNSLAATNQTYVKGLFQWHTCSVSYLDEELIFATLARKVLP
jgi:chemotaxis-related protein WspD